MRYVRAAPGAKPFHGDGLLRVDHVQRLFPRRGERRACRVRRVLPQKPRQRRLRHLRGAGAGGGVHPQPALYRGRHSLFARAGHLRRGLPRLPAPFPLHRRPLRAARGHGDVSQHAGGDGGRAADRGADRRNGHFAGGQPPVADRHQGQPHRARGAGARGQRFRRPPRPQHRLRRLRRARLLHRRRGFHRHGAGRADVWYPRFRDDGALLGDVLPGRIHGL